MLNNWRNIIQPVCVLCHAPDLTETGLCHQCQRLLPVPGHSCHQCASPLTHANQRQMLCGNCLREPPAFDKTTSLFAYDHPVDYLVQQMKFHGRLDIARSFGELLAARVTEEISSIEALLPVPLHVTRLQQRGFNQALEIARVVARRHGLPLITRQCVRHQATASQSDLPLRQRHRNVHNAFRIVDDLPYRSIAILDDVITTGQTVHALSLTLKKHGIEHIQVWSCARTILDS